MNLPLDWQIGASIPKSIDLIQSHVQAWARDSLTGEPVYIMELSENRRGAKCGCECPSCDLQLTAVNAAKSEYIKRPHFRHPNGAEKSDCLFLAARLAELQLLRERGVLQLPARRVLGKVLGLSGMQHEAWVEYPAERVKIRNFDFHDKAFALFTLDDGRQLRLQLIGSGIRSEDGSVLPTIFLDIKDAALAGMSLEELRKRATLIPDGLCWQSHWNDAELQGQANEVALAKAIDLMDIEGEYLDELKDIEPKFRRETLLHLEVKKILSEAGQIRVPSVPCGVSRIADDGYDIEKFSGFPSAMIPLMDVKLEKRFGSVIPDVTAQIPEEHGGVLLIEVTVTNTIQPERQKRIQENNVPALEIDLSRAGGLISRSELRELVIEGLELKRWLCHPAAYLLHQKLEAEADAELEERNDAIQEREDARQLTLKTPVEQIAKDYLNAIYLYQTADRNSAASNFDESSRLLRNVFIQAERLEIHGFGAAMDEELFGSRGKIIPRILAIKNGGGVGYDLDSTMGVMNAIKQTHAKRRTYHTLYLIAEAVYRKEDAPANPAWYVEWVEEIKKSIVSSAKMYARTRRYDRLLSLLFPEMRARLESPFGRENYFPKRRVSTSQQIRQHASQNTNRSSFSSSHQNKSPILKGQELEEWKVRNPDAAKSFFDNEGKALPAFEVLANPANK